MCMLFKSQSQNQCRLIFRCILNAVNPNAKKGGRCIYISPSPNVLPSPSSHSWHIPTQFRLTHLGSPLGFEGDADELGGGGGGLVAVGMTGGLVILL